MTKELLYYFALFDEISRYRAMHQVVQLCHSHLPKYLWLLSIGGSVEHAVTK
jgi:hypothetical protein